MADIVLGMAMSHGPMLTTQPDQWEARVAFDKVVPHCWQGSMWSYDGMLAERSSETIAAQLTPDAKSANHARCQSALDRMAEVFAGAEIDVAVIFGNDQREVFDESFAPALTVFQGEDISNQEFSAAKMAALPPGIADSIPGFIPAGGATYRGSPALGRAIIVQAGQDGFDVCALNSMANGMTPHAFGFVYRRIMRDDPMCSVPIMLNTFYPPNQPTIRRCFEFGRSVRRAITEWKSDARVAILGSGGLSHFAIDETLDNELLEALRSGDLGAFLERGEEHFQGGTSELKSWIALAGAMAGGNLRAEVVDYVPCYRSEAGTGSGMGFVTWRE